MQDSFEILKAGLERYQRRDFAEAERLYREVIGVDPAQADAHHLLGILLFETGRIDEALISLRRALHLNPQFADAHYNLGRALGELKRFDEALVCYKAAIRCRPGFAAAHFNLGNLYRDLNQSEQAIACYRRAIDCDAQYAKARANLRNLLLTLGTLRLDESRPDEALQYFEEALRLKPDDAEALTNVGAAHVALGQYDQAVVVLRKAISLHPDFVAAHVNLASARHEQGAFQDAIASCRRAIAIQPDCAAAHFNLGIEYLLAGDFERGWAEYDWRALSPLAPKNRPRWDGSSPAGKTILLYPEQGMGDTIQFIRFASLLKQRGARVLFGCPEPLRRLLESFGGIDQLLSDRESLPPFDCYAPVLSLPGFLDVRLQTIPADVPYLIASANLVETWREKLSHLEGFRVGIAWQGNPKYKGDRHRSVPLAEFEPLARINGVRLISLQQGPGVEQIASLRDRFPLHDPGPLRDFTETAAVIANLDLVITIDSAVAHLAGALGAAVWTILPTIPDWRWLLHRNDTPWYPTMRLFRQPTAGEWPACFSRLASQLHDKKGDRTP